MAYLIYIKLHVKLHVKLNYIKFTCKLSRPWMSLQLENAMLISMSFQKRSQICLNFFFITREKCLICSER